MGETESSVVRKLTADGFVFVVGDSMANLNGFHVFLSLPNLLAGQSLQKDIVSSASMNND